MTELHETEVDGVRCFWVEADRPTLAARLVFRFGMVDEPMVESGWQHLLEHLALEGRGGGALDVNGSVGLLHTAFDAHGPAELVAAHLDELTTWLSAPELGRLTHEVKVLRAEAALREGNIAAEALVWRYGAVGPGLAAYQGPATGRATADALTDRAERVFTQGNAVLVLDGPPPKSLRLRIRPGDAIPTPPAVPCVSRRPAAYVEPRGLIVSGVVQRSPAISLGHDLLRQAFQDELRTGAGAAYAPWASYEPVDDDHAVVLGGSDLSRDVMSTIVNRTLQMVRKLRTYAPTEERLENLRAAALQRMADPLSRMGMAVASAHEALAGREPRSPQAWLDQMRDVTATGVRDAFEEFHSTLLFGVPGEATWDDPLRLLRPAGSGTVVRGRRRRSMNWPADSTRLVIGDEGLELRAGKDQRTVPVPTVVGMLAFEDGRRHVVQADGFGMSVDPRDWHGGRQAVERLDRVIPSGLHLPLPAADVPQPERLGLVRRWTWPVTRTLARPSPLTWVAVLVFLAGMTLAVVATTRGHGGGLVLAIVVTVFLMRTLAGSDDP